MRLEDARRLTGPNLYSLRPLVLVELVLEPGDTVEKARKAFIDEFARMREALSLSPAGERVGVRAGAQFLALTFEAPLDEMLADTEAAEWAGLSAVELLAGRPALPLEPKRTEIAAMLVRDLDWRLPALEAEAAKRNIPFTWDDELVSLGQGHRALHFDRHRLPNPKTVAWDSLGSVPIALITGTNGKTTSTRLLAHMAKEAGLKVGTCSSDAVIVDGKTLREGDWTGPAAARLVLRSPEVDVAILETARGGILRRGLAYERADVALITNITDDHLGTYGIESLDDMLKVKAVTTRAAKVAVLNANDPRLSSLAHPHLVLFAVGDELIRAHCAKGGRAVVAREGHLVALHGRKEEILLPVADVPITFNGEARYNIENALGAVAAAQALGIPTPAIIRALKSFTAADNPGRGETWTRSGVTLFLDFAHNPEGVAAALRVAGSLRQQGQLLVITGSAGDRTNAELEAIVDRIHHAQPSLVVVRELTHYLRGRAPGEVPQFLRRALEARGVKDLVLGSSEVECFELALKHARPGDVIALLVHVDRDPVRRFLDAGGWQRG